MNTLTRMLEFFEGKEIDLSRVHPATQAQKVTKFLVYPFWVDELREKVPKNDKLPILLGNPKIKQT